MPAMALDRSDLLDVGAELVLYGGSLPATPLRDLAAAAASAGFDAITLWPLMYRRALSREGLTPADIRALLTDHGVRVTDLDPCTDWLPVGPGGATAGPFKAEWTRHQFFDLAAEVGADTLTAVHLTGGTVDHDVAVEGYGQLCDDAAEHGLVVALEFMPFSGIPDLAAGWGIVGEADRPNGGLVIDVNHVRRSGSDLGLLDEIPPGMVRCVQLGDGPATPPGSTNEALLDEAMYHRRIPGEGDFDVAGFLRTLDAHGVRTRVGPEIFQERWRDQPAADTAAELMAGTLRVLAR
jgi:sugar phosphate isomerase/epimerase